MGEYRTRNFPVAGSNLNSGSHPSNLERVAVQPTTRPSVTMQVISLHACSLSHVTHQLGTTRKNLIKSQTYWRDELHFAFDNKLVHMLREVDAHIKSPYNIGN